MERCLTCDTFTLVAFSGRPLNSPEQDSPRKPLGGLSERWVKLTRIADTDRSTQRAFALRILVTLRLNFTLLPSKVCLGTGFEMSFSDGYYHAHVRHIKTPRLVEKSDGCWWLDGQRVDEADLTIIASIKLVGMAHIDQDGNRREINGEWLMRTFKADSSALFYSILVDGIGESALIEVSLCPEADGSFSVAFQQGYPDESNHASRDHVLITGKQFRYQDEFMDLMKAIGWKP